MLLLEKVVMGEHHDHGHHHEHHHDHDKKEDEAKKEVEVHKHKEHHEKKMSFVIYNNNQGNIIVERNSLALSIWSTCNNRRSGNVIN